MQPAIQKQLYKWNGEFQVVILMKCSEYTFIKRIGLSCRVRELLLTISDSPSVIQYRGVTFHKLRLIKGPVLCDRAPHHNS